MSTPDTNNAPSGGSNADSVETVRKVYVRDLHPKQQLHTVFRVGHKARQTARSGKAFLTVRLEDRTGELDARVFDQIDAFDAAFTQGDYVLVGGEVISFHGKPQLVIQRLQKLDPEPLDPKEFTPPPAPPAPPKEQAAPRAPAAPGAGGAGLRETVERLSDPQVRALLTSVLEDPELRLGGAKGNAADRIAASARLAARVAEHYAAADRDLVVAGVIVRELGRSRASQRDHQDEGRLLGPGTVIAARLLEHAARLEGAPRLLAQHLGHLALATQESAVTVEAMIVAHVEALDAQVSRVLEVISREGPNEKWADPARGFDRHLWKGAVPTSRGRAPVEPRKRRERAEKKERGPEVEKKEAAPKLAFKPLAELAPDAGSAATEAAGATESGGAAELPPTTDNA